MYTTKVIKTKRVRGTDGYQTSKIDIDKFSKEIEAKLNNLKTENTHLIKILPVISGQYNWEYNDDNNNSYGFGYGYGYTEGVIIIGEKDE